ncbi:MAG: translation elongation factor 4 [Planctomycetales bacterium]|nr:translation elongation factor 4 [Planctomycetales bacterium]
MTDREKAAPPSVVVADIRNFCIIAHVDHGKSTLADRLLLRTGAISPRDFRDQVLDDMDLERERGITIKASAVALAHERAGKRFRLNLIDTPGHVDFSYEVRRSLAACEGALLVVDASQGVEAQTVANTYQAVEAGLEIVPILNKIDLPNARIEEVLGELQTTFGMAPETVLRASAKTGDGVDRILDAVLDRVPPPKGDPSAPLQALIFDSKADDFRGVVIYVRVVNGRVAARDRIRLLGSGGVHEVAEVGTFRPAATPAATLAAGEVGYVVAGIKDIHDVRIGDTVAAADAEGVPPLPGYREPKPMVFCGLYPTEPSEYNALRKALERLRLNDSAFTFTPDTSDALGFGFRCGFLGLLHMEIVQERLERESHVDLVQTAPSVPFEVVTTQGEVRRIETPSELPPEMQVAELREPVVRVSVIAPVECLSPIHTLAQERRGAYVRTEYLSPTRVIIVYDVPLANVIYDFHDVMKSATRGYGTMDYEVTGFRASDLVRLTVFVNGIEVDALSTIVHRSEAERRGRRLLRSLRKEIPRHLFEVVLQAGIGQKIIARESIAPLRKDVTAKCYGGDISRKRKLLEKQKEGKRRMKQVGRVEIPQKAFLAVLSTGEGE